MAYKTLAKVLFFPSEETALPKRHQLPIRTTIQLTQLTQVTPITEAIPSNQTDSWEEQQVNRSKGDAGGKNYFQVHGFERFIVWTGGRRLVTSILYSPICLLRGVLIIFWC